jgi:hypothetical protein
VIEAGLEPARRGRGRVPAAEGVPYCLPKPYLLVTALPVEQARPRPPAPPQVDGAGQESPGGPQAEATSTGNTSFFASTDHYVIKLIYLPDLSERYVIRESPGLFGTVQMKPQFQDGWMLASLEASSDMKVADTINALASLAGSLGTAVAGARRPGAEALALRPLPTDRGGLRPGLYRFRYDGSGVLTGLDPVVLFLRGRDGPDDVPLMQRPGGIANGGRSGPRLAQQGMQIHMPFLNLQQHLALATS